MTYCWRIHLLIQVCINWNHIIERALSLSARRPLKWDKYILVYLTNRKCANEHFPPPLFTTNYYLCSLFNSYSLPLGRILTYWEEVWRSGYNVIIPNFPIFSRKPAQTSPCITTHPRTSWGLIPWTRLQFESMEPLLIGLIIWWPLLKINYNLWSYVICK